ncbi:radical SAM protein [Desulfobulbus alkaliphilus]|uniref:radical SAM protein n=1 Tax=Desulfobulbus alkaliphilus TaxID=869814 RepID=UPI001966A834|nr:radical SAM protein [Desulfobulbus alkaliphilus]MBM9536065.1 radical SAM protein [Desulfobulbus alkaliphilus]
MKYIFGPVHSRRLGRSLGIDLFSKKLCNLNCIYCEAGANAALVNKRGLATPTREIIAEINTFCSDVARLDSIDVFTVTAKGEPTLHLGLGEILLHLKKITSKPLAILTNSTTLTQASVRDELMPADIVIPSLDAARQESFSAVNRPASSLDLDAIIDGLTRFSQQFPQQIWLEILLVRGLNDSPEDMEALQAAIAPMRIDRIQLNTVLRPPPEATALPLSHDRLRAIAASMEKATGLPVDYPEPSGTGHASGSPTSARHQFRHSSPDALREEIVNMVQRRPCSAADLERVFQLGGPEQVEQLLEPLVKTRILHRSVHAGTRYYQASSIPLERPSSTSKPDR